jgi:hypothetical protein
MRSATSNRSPGFLLFALMVGCGSQSMVEVAAPLPDLPRTGAAMVVFIQPSSYAQDEYFPIFDHTGRFLGDSEPVTWFAVELPPGAYEFYSSAQNTAAVRAVLAADRTYFVEVASRPGFFQMRAQLLPIAPRFSSWEERDTWLAETRAQRTAYASTLDPEDIADIVAAGHENLADYTPEELARRTLLASDGI